MIKTEDFTRAIGCRVCNNPINYIGTLDTTKTIESTRIVVDSAVAVGTFHATDGQYIEVEVLVTCPSCKSKFKDLNAAKVIK
ncbi:hypothetical protein [Peribacillus simplex]|uniref:hypothetical protein n=1 Tax=Peribacillus simplex TaxID=1478 RepID=UPI003D2CB2A0